MSTPSRRRLMRDFKKLQDDSPAGICAAPTEDNILIWEAYIFGPQDTPFEDGTFKLTLEFTEEYPNKPPTVKFVSKMFHPNVYADGSICMDLLQKLWTPTYDVAGILMCIQSLLNEPNPTSPANSEAAQLYQDDRIAYEKRVQQIVEQSWMNEEAWRQYDVKQTVSHRHPYASASNEYCDDPMTGHGRLASSSSSTDHHPTHNSHRSAVYVKNEIKAEP